MWASKQHALMDSVPPSIPMTISNDFSSSCFLIEVDLECCFEDLEAYEGEVVGVEDDSPREDVGTEDGSMEGDIVAEVEAASSTRINAAND